MSEAFKGMVHLECGECGARASLAAAAGRGDFLATGWRSGDLGANGPAFRCAACFAAERVAEELAVRKKYLAHMFEAQRRFGE